MKCKENTVNQKRILSNETTKKQKQKDRTPSEA